MLFEAGALAQHGDQPRLFAYLYGIDQLTGPLSHSQTTRFDKEDSLKFAKAFADAIGVDDEASVVANFNKTWDEFKKKVDYGMLFSVQQLVPEFTGLFKNKKTFYESFPRCSNKLWEDRLRRTVRTHNRLSQDDIAEILTSDPYLSGAYANLLWALDSYNMHIAAHLLKNINFKTLGPEEQNELEDARKRIVEIVSILQQPTQPPVFPESVRFESEPAMGKRKIQIYEMTARLRQKEFSEENLLAACDSLRWALDRIVFYIAVEEDYLLDIQLEELILHLKREAEIARTLYLIEGPQPLYYVAECIDNKIDGLTDATLKNRLSKILDEIDKFLEDNRTRDSGGHIKRRIESIREQLK